MAEHKTFHVLEALETGPARTRRSWSQSAKDRILAEASVPGANVSAMARAHGLSVQQVFHWRREARKILAASSARAGAAGKMALSFIELAPATKSNRCFQAAA